MLTFMSEQQQCFEALKNAVIEMEDDEAAVLAETVIEKGFSVREAIQVGLMEGMEKVSELYAKEEYFIPDLLACADTMYIALNILEPHLENTDCRNGINVIIGTVEGDTHDIGKNIVALFLKSAGFNVYDIGRDITPALFAEKAREYEADIIVMSTIMTTTMENMKKTIDYFIEQGIRDQFRFMVGGKPVSKRFSDTIGADGYSSNAQGAVNLAKKLSGLNEVVHDNAGTQEREVISSAV